MYVENRLTLFINRGAVFHLCFFFGLSVLLLLVLVDRLYERTVTIATAAPTSPVRVHYVMKEQPALSHPQAAKRVENTYACSESEHESIMANYIQYVLEKIEANKIYPETERARAHQGVVGMKLLLERSGEVKKLVITQQPEFSGLLQAAVSAIQRSMPFKPLPFVPGQEIVQIDFKIRFSLN